MAEVIDGKTRAAQLRGRIRDLTVELATQQGVTPGLAVVIVGDDPASQVYVRNKGRQAREAGFESFTHRLSASASAEELLAIVDALNADPAVHGILVQLPLPPQIDAREVINRIDPTKDVDGFHTMNVGRLTLGQPTFVPCTPLGCWLLLREALPDMVGLNAVVVGRSNIVGKPMAALLLGESCTVTTAHSKTRDLPAVCRDADILVAAVGRPKMIGGDWIKPGAVVVDVGINRLDLGDGKSRLVGDVDFAAASEAAAMITPVPGGVGPMTIACLLANTLYAARMAAGQTPASALEGLIE
ncbi:MAG: bifunctional methylenetetrahydrofolate dehydrogenase/methenyltetrahydrofolate cyclohydrolase FolD [Pseudomonadota bacterium]